MKLKQGLIVSALAASALLVGVMPAVAQSTIRCDGDVTGEINGNVVVPRGADCFAEDATINGNVTVGRDSDLLTTSVTVNGNVVAQNNAYVDVLDTAINGSVRFNNAYGLYMELSGAASSITGTLGESGVVTILDSDARSIVRLSGGDLFIGDEPFAGGPDRDGTGLGSRITGDLTATDVLSADIYNTVMYSDLSVTGASDDDRAIGSVLCSNEIDGQTSLSEISGGGSIIQIGTEDVDGNCGYNVMGGDVEILDNRTEITVAGNTIRGNVICEGNDPAPVIGANRLRGEGVGQCAAPMETATATPDAQARLFSQESAEATDRRADAEARIAERRAAAGYTEPAPEVRIEAEKEQRAARASDAEAAPEAAPERIEGRPLPSRSRR